MKKGFHSEALFYGFNYALINFICFVPASVIIFTKLTPTGQAETSHEV